MKNFIFKYSFLFLLGGMSYYFLEIFYRGFSHYSMIICGGLAFIFSGVLNQLFPKLSITTQMFLSTIIITLLELLTGLIVNIGLNLNVWDYSKLPYNFLGQICLQYSIVWFFLSFLCIFIDDFLRVKLFNEKKVSYKL